MVRLPVGVKIVRLPVLPLARGKESVKTEIENNEKEVMIGNDKYVLVHFIIIKISIGEYIKSSINFS